MERARVMPFYRCLIPEGSLSYDQRERIAVAFTDVHCGISTAPRRFVQVAFLETTDTGEVADTHGSGMLCYTTPYFIAGGNRAGRSPETKRLILEGLIERFCHIAEVSQDQVSGKITEAPASWTMEAGKILPEPGAEPAEWYE
ncbi:MAG: hypothetical protein OXC19_00825 [Bryobacterales bacterium]|nr:hypothetical protein [Bryobacterales bacterium]